MKFVNLGDSCTVGGDHAMNIIIARVPVLNVSENPLQLLGNDLERVDCYKYLGVYFSLAIYPGPPILAIYALRRAVY